MDKTTELYWKQFAGQTGMRKDGYVYIGKGSLSDPLYNFWGRGNIFQLSTDGFDRLLPDADGCVTSFDYYVSKETWGKRFGALEAVDIPARIKRAESLIGKKVKFKSAIMEVVEVALWSGNGKLHSVYHNISWFCDFLRREESRLGREKEFKEQGFYIVLIFAEKDNGKFCANCFSNVEEVKEEPWESVEVNGYKAKKDGEMFIFGCARIHREQLEVSRNLLKNQSVSMRQGNRNMEAVKIGAGEFTLEILEKLLA